MIVANQDGSGYIETKSISAFGDTAISCTNPDVTTTEDNRCVIANYISTEVRDFVLHYVFPAYLEKNQIVYPPLQDVTNQDLQNLMFELTGEVFYFDINPYKKKGR